LIACAGVEVESSSEFCDEDLSSNVFLRVKEISSVSSGIVANFLSTCFKAGRLMGLLFVVNQCQVLDKGHIYLRNSSIPESIHSLTLLSSANAVKATIGAE
jgi:hypothetical protein